MEEKEIVPWESLDLNADQKASSAKEALRNRVDKMPHPVDALPSPPCWLSVYIQSGPPSYLVSDGDCTWAQWHGHPHTKMELLASAERTMCQQQGPALSLNMSPFPRGTSQPSHGCLIILDSIMKGAASLPWGNVSCSGWGFAFSAFRSANFADLQNIWFIAIVSNMMLPPPGHTFHGESSVAIGLLP